MSKIIKLRYGLEYVIFKNNPNSLFPKKNLFTKRSATTDGNEQSESVKFGDKNTRVTTAAIIIIIMLYRVTPNSMLYIENII